MLNLRPSHNRHCSLTGEFYKRFTMLVPYGFSVQPLTLIGSRLDFVEINKHMQVHTYIYIYIYMYKHKRVHILCIYTYTYIYIYTHTL